VLPTNSTEPLQQLAWPSVRKWEGYVKDPFLKKSKFDLRLIKSGFHSEQMRNKTKINRSLVVPNIVTYFRFVWVIKRVLDLMIVFIVPLYNLL
jgi:hypothetical protein